MFVKLDCNSKWGDVFMEKLSFIHAADLHIDSPFRGLTHINDALFKELRTSTFQAFDQIIAEAIKREVDFILLVGDLFDHEKQSLHAQVHLREGFKKLEQHRIEVYISYGNHDYLDGNIHQVTYPKNVHIFTSENVSHFTFMKNGKPLANIYGFSYKQQAVYENKTKEYMIKDESTPYHIAMLHGSTMTNTEHDRYAPFHLSDLTQKPFDYWALGHIHKREILNENPLIVYPGNTQGRHRNETGVKGCYYVSFNGKQEAFDFIETQALTFENYTLDMDALTSIFDLETTLIEQLCQHYQNDYMEIIDLTLTSTQMMHLSWNEAGSLQEIIDIVNEYFIRNQKKVFVVRFELEVSASWQKALESSDFLNTLVEEIDELNVNEVTAPLMHHRQGRKYLERFSKSEEEKIRNYAKQLLMKELLGGDLK